MKFSQIFKSVFFVFLIKFSIDSHGRGQEGHGGDLIVGLFKGAVNNVMKCIYDGRTAKDVDPFLYSNLYSAYLLTRVVSEERTYLNDEEVDAINFSDENGFVIRLNRSRLSPLGLNMSHMSFLALHEYLSVAGYYEQEKNYSVSWPIFQKNLECFSKAN